VCLWRSPRRWSRGATNPVQIRWKSHVSVALPWGKWPYLIRRNRSRKRASERAKQNERCSKCQAIYIRIYIYIYMCVCVHKHTHTHTHALPLLSCLHSEQPEHAPVRWPSTAPSPPHASKHVFLMGVRPARRQLWRQAQRPAIPGGSAAQPPLQQGGAGGQGQLAACSAGLSRRRGDSFGGRLNSLQSRAGQQRSHPYGKAVLAARASSPPAVQGSGRGVVVIFNNEWLRPVFDENPFFLI